MLSKLYRQKTGLAKVRTVWQRFFPCRRYRVFVLAVVYAMTLQYVTPIAAYSQCSSPLFTQISAEAPGIRMVTMDEAWLSTDRLMRSEQESKRVFRLPLRSTNNKASEKTQKRSSYSVLLSSFVTPPLLFLRKILPRSVQDDPFLG